MKNNSPNLSPKTER